MNDTKKQKPNHTFTPYVWCPICFSVCAAGTACPECKTVTTKEVSDE